MKTLQDYFKEAREGRYAIGHFNFSTPDVLRAIVHGAQAGGAPCVMVGTSEGESEFLGLPQAVALVRAIREAAKFPVVLNADHFKSFQKCKEAIDAGYDTVLFDGGRLSYEENIEQTKRVWQYAQLSRGNMMIEGEIGYLKGSSQVQKSVTIGPDDYTKPEQAADYVHRTAVERLAIVFGNIHGIVTEQEEHLDISHLIQVAAAVPKAFLVLHGASGLPDAEVAAAIRAGITNVHFNTELRMAYTQGLRHELQTHPEMTTPHQLLQPAADKVRQIVEQKVRVFMNR
jgi:ketose-bisphosphate aldolase